MLSHQTFSCYSKSLPENDRGTFNTAEMTATGFKSLLWILSHAAKHPKVNRNRARHRALLWNEITDEKREKMHL